MTQYKLDPQGLHGLPHWERVLQNGLRLAEHTGADSTVITLFALFHDACRENEWKDKNHGPWSIPSSEAQGEGLLLL